MARTDNLAPVRLEIVEAHGIQRDNDGWEHYSYEVRLSRGDESMRSPWRAGLACEEPTAADVLESLILDAQGFRHTPFEEWCANYGYDTDSRRVLALYERIGDLSEQLFQLLGSEDFEAAMNGEAEKVASSLTDDDD